MWRCLPYCIIHEAHIVLITNHHDQTVVIIVVDNGAPIQQTFLASIKFN
jgi:sensor histidine kinase YesM